MRSALTILLLLSGLLAGCSTTYQTKNWSDDRCILYKDAIQRIKETSGSANRGAAISSLLSGHAYQAYTSATGGGVVWVKGYSGNGQLVMVGYNELKEQVSIHDLNGVEISLADFKRLGPVTTQYDNTAEYTREFQMRQNNPMPTTFSAAPMPPVCELVRND